MDKKLRKSVEGILSDTTSIFAKLYKGGSMEL